MKRTFHLPGHVIDILAVLFALALAMAALVLSSRPAHGAAPSGWVETR